MSEVQAETINNNNNDNGTLREEENTAKKKRFAEKEMRREDVHDSDEEASSEQGGTWRRAEETVISQRKRVKVRRGNSATIPEETPTPTPTPATEPPKFNFTFNFTTAPTKTPEKKEDEASSKEGTTESKETEEKKKEETKSTAPTFNFNSPFNSFTPSYTFSTQFSFSSGSSPSTTSSGPSIFGTNIAPPSAESDVPEFVEAADVKIEAKANLPPPEPQKTGEEDETHIFQTRAKLFIFDKADNTWHERGVGQVRVNVSKDGTSGARLLMRVEGSLRLVLNVALWPAIKLEKAGEKAVRFTGPSTETPGELCVYLARVGSADAADQLIKAVEDNKHKGGPAKESTTTTTTTTTTTSSSPAKK